MSSNYFCYIQPLYNRDLALVAMCLAIDYARGLGSRCNSLNELRWRHILLRCMTNCTSASASLASHDQQLLAARSASVQKLTTCCHTAFFARSQHVRRRSITTLLWRKERAISHVRSSTMTLDLHRRKPPEELIEPGKGNSPARRPPSTYCYFELQAYSPSHCPDRSASSHG